MENTELSFIALIERSIKTNWNLDALTDYKGATLQYNDVARKIEKIHIAMEGAGIQPGDKIAICGRNSAHWTVTFLAIITYGAVAVPILHEFKPDQIHNIVNHSEARALFAGDQIWENLNEEDMPLLEGIIEMKDFDVVVSRSEQLTYAREHLNEIFGQKYPCRFRPEDIHYRREESPEELCISYGAHLWFLTRMPSPKIIMESFAEIRPRIISCVPLVVEKIFKKSVLPKIDNKLGKLLLKVPIVNDRIRERINQYAM